VVVWLAWLLACRCGDDRPAPVAAEQAAALALAVDVPFAEIDIPPSCRPEGREPPDRIPLSGPWRALGPNKGMSRFEADLPVRPRGLFFHVPQPGLDLLDADGAPVEYARGAARKRPYWNHERETFVVAVPGERGPPQPGEFALRWPTASERERALNLATSGRSDPADFVRSAAQIGWDSRQGVLLPAPGRLAWDIDVPPAAELHFAPGIVPPEVRDGPASDGARLVLEVVEGDTTTQVFTADLEPGKFAQRRVDLSRWSGRRVRLRARSEPGPTATFDYVFLAEPILASRKADPQTVLLVFVDTMRRDHLDVYGYDRDTSRAIDGFAAQSVVFEQARSVAPWTLPSARTILSGRQPEEYEHATTLQAALRARGWATGMIAGNVYLSPNFGMNAGWDYQHVTNLPDATEVSAQGRQWLAEHDGQDRLLLVHFMDPHLPYEEPAEYRYEYAAEAPDGLPEKVTLDDVKGKPLGDAGQAWIKARYDNNVRFALDEAAKVIAAVDDDDVVVLFADHGEELWDHRGFEHGHTLFDELLRVPLIVRAPGFAPSRVDAPVSLLDLTPTVLDLLGVEVAGLDGRPLTPLMRGEASAAASFAARDQAFGRPLYGGPRWGVLHDGDKWVTNEGHESLYHLASDPEERDNALRADPAGAGGAWPERLGAALERDVAIGYRLMPSRANGPLAQDDFVVRVDVPGGITAAWAGDDPLKGSMVLVELRPLDTTADPPTQTAIFTWLRGYHGTREAYLVPRAPVEEVTPSVVFHVEYGEDRDDEHPIAGRAAAPGPQGPPLISARYRRSRTFTVGWGYAPQPNAETAPIEGSDDELKSALEALGYVEGREDAPAPK
jgi:arylsulfatase A-like enzyme